MKKLILCATILFSGLTFAQDNGYFFGGFESNSQWLLDDEDLNFEAPEDQFRANNYFKLDYTLGKFTAGVQYEAYVPSALLGYAPVYDGENGIGTYYLNFKTKDLDITGGYFYEQFGSGLLLRSWEDRQLGINSALKGIRVAFTPLDYLDITGVYGQQRNGFEVSDGTVQGIDTNIDISEALDMESFGLTFGASYVGRYQSTGTNDSIPSTVNAYGGRFDFTAGNFYGGIEANIKDPDVIANEGQISSNKLYDGTSMQVDLGYSRKGLGINGTFRRLENFVFYSDRLAEGNIYNQQLINYTPALTKQQDYMLTNIYVYNAQPRLVIESYDQRAGEVGTQFDLYYRFDKDSWFGKYKTKVAANFSYWAGLEAEYNIENRWYEAEFIGKGPRLFRDYSIEVKNRWNKDWSSVVTFQNTIVDKGIVYGGPLGTEGDIQASIAVVEGTRKFEGGKSMRLVLQHLWSEEDRENWAAGVLEYNFNSRLAVYVADSWNYGGDDEIHYYSLGGSYSKGRTRLGLNYGRQRGGLICVGGVCRFVPENTGLTANLTVTF